MAAHYHPDNSYDHDEEQNKNRKLPENNLHFEDKRTGNAIHMLGRLSERAAETHNDLNSCFVDYIAAFEQIMIETIISTRQVTCATYHV